MRLVGTDGIDGQVMEGGKHCIKVSGVYGSIGFDKLAKM